MSRHAACSLAVDDRGDWWALTVLCLGALLIATNATMVNVALPSIGLDLRFSDASLVWVVNAYSATFGGFLLLGGRLGDLFGHRRLFLLGISLFTLASLGCGFATSPVLLVAARSAQGLGGAVMLAVALSQITNLFADAPRRARAFGIYVFVSASGGGIGLLLGGALTSALSWRWVFLIIVPIGVGVYGLCIAFLPRDENRRKRGRLDILGAVAVTASLMLAVYSIVNANQVGWSSAQTLTLLASAVVLLLLFVGIEVRVRSPLIPLELFRIRNLTVVSMVGALLSAAVLSWSFTSALYLQFVLHFGSLQVGLALLPAHLTIAMMSLVGSPILVIRYGLKRPLVIGMIITCVGLAFLAQAPVGAKVVLNVLPGMLLLGLGYGMAYHPMLLSALSSVAPCDSGTASGIITTSSTMGGALGLSVLASIAAARTDDLLVSGVGLPSALNSGYQVTFSIAAAFAALAALISGMFVRDTPQPHPGGEKVCTEIRWRSVREDTHS